jgi:hypothetical protein
MMAATTAVTRHAKNSSCNPPYVAFDQKHTKKKKTNGPIRFEGFHDPKRKKRRNLFGPIIVGKKKKKKIKYLDRVFRLSFDGRWPCLVFSMILQQALSGFVLFTELYLLL